MFKNIPQSRLLFYILVLGLIPVILVGFLFLGNRTGVMETSERIEQLQAQSLLNQKREAVNVAVIDHYRNADRFYVDKHIEVLQFLQPEMKGLRKVMENKNFAGNEAIKNRLDFLTGSENRLLFSEGPAEVYSFFQESTAALARPVEVNSEDIKKILSTIEGVEIGENKPGPDRPQLIITEFDLSRQKVSEANEVFALNMKLLRREFAQ